MNQLEGYKGFFKGNGVNLVKIIPFSALEFYFYEVYKSNLFPADHKLGYMDKLICGGLTGMTASFAVYPMDLVKTYLTINVDNAV
jgi:solute carrier family 25 (mitochondrial phosphate transporter), member 23/24/25/41